MASRGTAMTKKKIVILGGGVAGLTAAFELTSQPDWRDHIESITLYQMGWRLGGKCASGRGPSQRIQEHGIHLFGGGYYNALAMMKGCYDELSKSPGWPLTFDQAFRPQYFSVGWEGPLHHRARSTTDLPENELGPAEGHKLPTVRSWVVRVIKLVKELYKRNFGAGGKLASIFTLESASPLRDGNSEEYYRVLEILQQLQEHFAADTLNPIAANELMRQASTWLELRLKPMSDHDLVAGDWKQSYLFAQFAWAVINGTLWDVFIWRMTFDELDEEDYALWLWRFGASEEALALSVALSPLRILYQFPDGDHANKPTMGAGAYLHWMLRTMAYLKAPFWMFAAGTGDTVIAPLYEVLKRRGVLFKFFHKVEALRLNGDGSAIAAVDIGVQATLKPKYPVYEPLVTAQGLQCWPATPRYEQLVEGNELERDAIDLESYWSAWTPRSTLRLAAGTDFDTLVFAISLGAVPYIGQELTNGKQAWRDMVDHLHAVQTQSFQIWLNDTSGNLGVGISPIHSTDTVISCGYEEPFDGLADFTPLLDWEGWPAQTAKAVWYFSDVLERNETPPPAGNHPDYPQRQKDRIEGNAIYFLDHCMAPLLPGSVKTGAFDYTLLTQYDPNGSAGKQLFKQQWWVANIEPSELYVQAPADTTRYRLKADKSGYKNLILAGDWTYNGLNVGCVEAAVTSGMLASNAITGYPHLDTIMGYEPRIG